MQKARNSIVSSSIQHVQVKQISIIWADEISDGSGPDVLFVELIFKQQCRMCMWSEKLNLLQRSQNIYVIVQNLNCFALVSLSIFLCFSASSIPIMAAWEPLSELFPTFGGTKWSNVLTGQTQLIGSWRDKWPLVIVTSG